MSFRKFLLSRTFLLQLIIAAVVIVALIFITMRQLKVYTHHGESLPVPDFSGMQADESAQVAKAQKIKTEVIDSVYVNDVPSGAVIDQVPEAGFKVKENRTIFLTINSTQPEQVTIPKLTDISYRQARVLIENSGLKVGQISYRPSEYNNLVLNIRINSENAPPGGKVAKGTEVDLIIGRTQGNEATALPNLIGLSVEEATNKLTQSMLNMGVLIYDGTIISDKDSLNARVWKQSPAPKVVSSVSMGASVDVWITVDALKIKKASDPEYQ